MGTRARPRACWDCRAMLCATASRRLALPTRPTKKRRFGFGYLGNTSLFRRYVDVRDAKDVWQTAFGTCLLKAPNFYRGFLFLVGRLMCSSCASAQRCDLLVSHDFSVCCVRNFGRTFLIHAFHLGTNSCRPPRLPSRHQAHHCPRRRSRRNPRGQRGCHKSTRGRYDQFREPDGPLPLVPGDCGLRQISSGRRLWTAPDLDELASLLSMGSRCFSGQSAEFGGRKRILPSRLGAETTY